jgi:predicted ATPase
MQSACQLVEQLLHLAQNTQDPALLLWAHWQSGMTSYFLGDFALAQVHLEQGFALYDPRHHHSQAFQAGHDPGVGCLGFMSWVLWFLGYPDQALKRSQEALTLAQEMSRPLSVAFALSFAAALHQFRGEATLTQERAEAVITLSNEQKLPQWIAAGALLRGKALVEQGQAEEGIAQMCQGLAARRAMGAEGRLPSFLTLLAEAYGTVGQVEEGLTALTEALVIGNKSGERWWEAELYRITGTLTLQARARLGQGSGKAQASQGRSKAVDPLLLIPDPQSEAEASFLKAIAIAQRQQAKSWELRAATSLARLWQSQGKQKEAHHLLSEIYDWFTEGFDTADLQEAKSLIEELS